MSSRFPILTLMAVVLRLLGVFLALAGFAVGAYFGFIEPSQPGHRFGLDNLIMIPISVAGLVAGIFSFATGEIVGVLFAIEKNTGPLPTSGQAR